MCSGCASAPARREAGREDPVTPPSDLEHLASVPPIEPDADPEALERRWPIQEARAQKLREKHVAAHRRATPEVIDVRGACAGVNRRDYTPCPLDLLGAPVVVEDAPGGAIVRTPAAGVEVDRLRQLARCQVTMGPAETRGVCPLWQSGARVVVEVVDGNLALEISAQSPAAAAEIRRRVKALFSAAPRR